MSHTSGATPPPWLLPNPSPANIGFIHTLRSVAVLIVVFVHLGGWWPGTHHQAWSVYDWYKKLWPQPLGLYQDGGHLGVVLFFLISGYIITHVSLGETRRQFVIKRLFRLFPLFLLACLAMQGVALLSRTLGYPAPLGFRGDFTLPNLLESLLLINFPRGTPYITSVAWTLFIEAVFYLLIAVFIDHQQRRPLLSTFYILITLWTISLVHHQTTLLQALHLPELAKATPFVAILALGRTFYFWQRTSLPKHRVLAVAAACFLTFALTYTLLWRGKSTAEALSTFYVGSLTAETLSTYYVGILIFLALMHWPDWKTPRPLHHIANTSYSIYLLHIPAGGLVLEWIAPRMPFSLAFLAAFVTVLVVCQGTYQWIEVPFQTLGRKVIKRIHA